MQAPNPQKPFCFSLFLLTHSLLSPFQIPLRNHTYSSLSGTAKKGQDRRRIGVAMCAVHKDNNPPTVAWKCAQDFPWIVVDVDAGACYVRDVRLGASLRPGGCATLSCGRTGYGVGRKRGQRAVCSYGYVSKPWPGRDRNWSVKLVFWTGCARMRPNGVHKQSTQRGVPVRRRSSQ